jgi:hypothetical protein
VTVCALPEPVAAQSRDRARRDVWILIAVCLLTSLLGRLSYLVRPFNADGAMFIYMGKLVTQGGRVGYELIDNKFPTVGLITSPCWQAFGYCWTGYVLLQQAMVLFAAWLLARTAGRNLGQYAALPTGLFALVYLNFNFAVFGGFQLETLQTFFSTLAACAAIESLCSDDARDSFLVGLAAGVAAMVKPSGLAILAAFGLCLLFKRRRLVVHSAAAFAGLAIPLAATLVYFQAADLFPVLPTIYRQIADYAANSPWEPWDLSKPVIIILILGFPMLVRGYIFRRPQHRQPIRPDRIVTLFTILWLTLEAAGIVAQRRMYSYHFLVLAAPASLLFGLIPRKSRAISIAAALLAPAIFSVVGAVQVLADAPNSMLATAGEDYLASHAQPGDAVWMDGMMRLLLRTDLSPGSRYPMTFLWVNDDDAPLRYCREMLADFNQIRPKYIVMPTKFDRYAVALSERIKELGLRPQRKANFIHAFYMLHDYVLKNYHAEANPDDWETIYRRNY